MKNANIIIAATFHLFIGFSFSTSCEVGVLLLPGCEICWVSSAAVWFNDGASDACVDWLSSVLVKGSTITDLAVVGRTEVSSTSRLFKLSSASPKFVAFSFMSLLVS